MAHGGAANGKDDNVRILLFCALAASLCAQVIENSVTLIPKADDSATGILSFREKKANGANVLKFQAPASLSADVTWTLPTADGTSGQCLVTNGSGVFSFAACTNYWFRSGTTLSPVNSGDDLNLSGHITSSSTSGTKDIGSGANKWKDIYIGGSVYATTLDDNGDANNQIVINSGLRPSADNTLNVGGSSNRIAGLWVNSVTVNTLTYATGTGSTISLYANMAPYTNNNFALGTTSLRWSKVWTTDLDTSGAFTLGGDLTVGGHILSSATTGTKDIGSSTNRFATLYATNIDAAPTSGTTNYVKTRKFEVVDNAGGSTLWDIQVTSNVTTNNFKIRDNSGTYRLELVNKEETTGTTANEARLNYHTVPYAHNTWDLGTSAKRWKDLYLQGSATVAGSATVSGTVSAATLDDISDANNQIVLNAGFRPATDDAVNVGSSTKRISGIWTNSLTVNTLTYATGTGSTITLYANMAPFTNNNFALGTTSLRYSKLWVTDIDMSGTCTGCPGTMWARTAGGGIGGAVALISPVTTTDEMGTGRIYPLVTNTHSLGVSTRRWASVWATDFDGSGTLNISGASTLTGNVTFGGNLIPSSNETKTVGTSSSRLDIVYSRRFEANDGTYGRVVINNPGAGSNTGNAIAVNNASGTSKFYVSYGGTVSTGPISINGDIYTSTGGTYSIGDSTNRMKDIYATTGNFSSTLTVGGIVYPAAVIAGTGAPDGYGFYARSQDGSKEWFAFAYNGAGTYMGSSSNDSLTIRTNNLDRTTWSSGGDITHSYNMTISGNLTVSGTCTGCGAASYFTRNGAGYIYPTTTTDSLMIGSSSSPADKLEVSGGGIRLGGSLTFSSGSTYNIGSSGTRAGTVYTANLDVSGSCTGCGGGWTRVGSGTTYVYPTTTTDIVVVGGSSSPSGSYKLEIQGGGINSGGSIVPGSNISYSLGSSSLLWNVGYISTLRVADRIIGHASNSTGSVMFAGSVFPSSDATFDLGDPSGIVQWRDLRLSGKVYVDGYSGLDSGTVTCGSGEAIKSLSFHGGIVTGYTCGTP